jgi:hypothetical protein
VKSKKPSKTKKSDAKGVANPFKVGEYVTLLEGGPFRDVARPSAILRIARVTEYALRTKITLEDGCAFNLSGNSWERSRLSMAARTHIRPCEPEDRALIQREAMVQDAFSGIHRLSVDRIRDLADADLEHVARIFGTAKYKDADAANCERCKRPVATEALRAHPENCACTGCDDEFCFGHDTSGCEAASGLVDRRAR